MTTFDPTGMNPAANGFVALNVAEVVTVTSSCVTATDVMAPVGAELTVLPVESQNTCIGNPLPIAIQTRFVNCFICGSAPTSPMTPPEGVELPCPEIPCPVVPCPPVPPVGTCPSDPREAGKNATILEFV